MCPENAALAGRAIVDGRLSWKGLAPPGAFEGKVVWITGASQGLGESLALYFAANGARLILSSRRKEQLEVKSPGGGHTDSPVEHG
jgi:dehydrogenase/reductase SDR family member 7